jgi:hypothetical protein
VSLVTYPYVMRPPVAPSFVPHNRRNPIEVHYLQAVVGRDDALGGMMAPGAPVLTGSGDGQQAFDKEATHHDLADLAPLETDAVRSAPHQSLVEEGSVTALAPEDAKLAAEGPAGEKSGVVLDVLNDLVNGPSLGDI